MLKHTKGVDRCQQVTYRERKEGMREKTREKAIRLIMMIIGLCLRMRSQHIYIDEGNVEDT